MGSVVESPPRSRGARILSVILPRLAFYPFLVASLIVFPAWLPWMIFGWLAIAAARRWRGKPAWPALGICLGMVLGKRMDWPPALVVLGVLIVVAGALDALRRKKPSLTAASMVAGFCLVPAWIGMAW